MARHQRQRASRGVQLLAGDAARHAFLYTGTPGSGGVMVDLGTLLGATDSYGRAINASGQVAGYSYSLSGEALYHAFRYTGTPGSGGVMADLGTLAAVRLGTAVPTALTTAGRSSGSATAGMENDHAFRSLARPAAAGRWPTSAPSASRICLAVPPASTPAGRSRDTARRRAAVITPFSTPAHPAAAARWPTSAPSPVRHTAKAWPSTMSGRWSGPVATRGAIRRSTPFSIPARPVAAGRWPTSAPSAGRKATAVPSTPTDRSRGIARRPAARSTHSSTPARPAWMGT